MKKLGRSDEMHNIAGIIGAIYFCPFVSFVEGSGKIMTKYINVIGIVIAEK
jgi:hypothetical protein